MREKKALMMAAERMLDHPINDQTYEELLLYIQDLKNIIARILRLDKEKKTIISIRTCSHSGCEIKYESSRTNRRYCEKHISTSVRQRDIKTKELVNLINRAGGDLEKVCEMSDYTMKGLRRSLTVLIGPEWKEYLKTHQEISLGAL